jgi:hypothetical protein
MLAAFHLTIAIVLIGVLYVALKAIGGAYLRFRGARVITCPETEKPAGVKVDVKFAALTAPFGKSRLRLNDCSRWPERRDCGQECLKQIESAPEECLVRNILTKWYHEKMCVLCHKPLGEINWLEHKPALMNADRRSVEWHEIRPEKLYDVLATHMPICWNCHIAETFRRECPELVVDRPWRNQTLEQEERNPSSRGGR